MGRIRKPIGTQVIKPPKGDQSPCNDVSMVSPIPLDETAMTEWNRIINTPVGKAFNESDLMVLALYCDSVSELVAARAKNDPKLVNRARTNIMSLTKQLGLTPASRNKVPRTETDNELSEWIGDIDAAVDRKHSPNNR